MKIWLAKIFGWKLVIVEYGYSSYMRIIRTSPSGKKYVKLWGDYLTEEYCKSHYNGWKEF